MWLTPKLIYNTWGWKPSKGDIVIYREAGNWKPMRVVTVSGDITLITDDLRNSGDTGSKAIWANSKGMLFTGDRLEHFYG
jgi:hypothetical protein